MQPSSLCDDPEDVGAVGFDITPHFKITSRDVQSPPPRIRIRILCASQSPTLTKHIFRAF